MRFIKSVLVCTGMNFLVSFYSFQCWIFRAGIFSTALVKVGLGDAVKAWLIPPPAAQAVFTTNHKPFPFSRETFRFNVEKGRCLRIFNKYC